MLERIDAELRDKLELLRAWQNADGGIPAYLAGDASGTWTTAEVLRVVLEDLRGEPAAEPASTFVGGLARFLSARQNIDGGWPYRDVGQSFVDPSAWCALALAQLGSTPGDTLGRAMDFLLDAQWRTGEWAGAWGIQRDEYARTYSTAIAVEALRRLGRDDRVRAAYPRLGEADAARRAGLDFLAATRTPEGAWGVRPGASPDAGSTAGALHALFANDGDPGACADSLAWLLAQREAHGGTWASFDEVLPLRVGLEVTLQWCAHPECVVALCGFARLERFDVGCLAEALESLWRFVDEQGRLRYTPDPSAGRYTWLVPFHLRALARARASLSQRRAEYAAYIERRREQEHVQRRRALQKRVYADYPFPVAEPFSRYEREADPLRRLRGLLDCAESLIILTASLALASLAERSPVAAGADAPKLKAMHRVTVGQWLAIARHIAESRASVAGSAVLDRIARTLDSPVSDDADGGLRVGDALDRLVKARNLEWGHGALATNLEYDQRAQRLLAMLEDTLAAFDWFAEYNLFYVTHTDEDEWNEQSLYTVVNCRGLLFGERGSLTSTRRLATGREEKPLYWGGTGSQLVLKLSPLWHFVPCPECQGRERFFCHQALDEQGAWYMSYECGHRIRLENRARFDALFKRVAARA